MPNVALIQDNGLPLILPAGSITAVLTTKRAANSEHPDAKCVIFSKWRTLSVSFLAQSAKEVAAEVAGNMPEGKQPLLTELTLLDDAQYIDASAITGVEGIKDGEDKFLRVYFNRHDGASIYADVDFDLLEILQGLMPENNGD